MVVWYELRRRYSVFSPYQQPFFLMWEETGVPGANPQNGRGGMVVVVGAGLVRVEEGMGNLIFI